MSDPQRTASAIADPIIDLIAEYSDVALTNNFVPHQISLSDVIKNDMKRQLDWDDDTINIKLWGIIKSGLDKNGRYRERPVEAAESDRHRKYSATYVDSQCLLTEWLAIYRSIRVYCGLARKRNAA